MHRLRIPYGNAPHGSMIRQQVQVQTHGLGWGWVGVGALAIIGISAIAYGQRHEVAEQIKSQRPR